MTKKIIETDKSPAAIGSYSQAVYAGNLLFVSGQIPLVAETMEIISEDFSQQATLCFENLKAICEEANATLDDIVKLNISMTNLANFVTVNEVMASFFNKPYPARAAVGVAALPKDVQIEIEAIVVIKS